MVSVLYLYGEESQSDSSVKLVFLLLSVIFRFVASSILQISVFLFYFHFYTHLPALAGTQIKEVESAFLSTLLHLP